MSGQEFYQTRQLRGRVCQKIVTFYRQSYSKEKHLKSRKKEVKEPYGDQKSSFQKSYANQQGMLWAKRTNGNTAQKLVREQERDILFVQKIPK